MEKNKIINFIEYCSDKCKNNNNQDKKQCNIFCQQILHDFFLEIIKNNKYNNINLELLYNIK